MCMSVVWHLLTDNRLQRFGDCGWFNWLLFEKFLMTLSIEWSCRQKPAGCWMKRTLSSVNHRLPKSVTPKQWIGFMFQVLCHI